jgi:hypothetical protein
LLILNRTDATINNYKKIIIIKTKIIGIVNATNIPKQPLETILPIFCCLPLLVNGIPIFREMFDFAVDIPVALFQENPPLFIIIFSLIKH